MTHRVLGGGDKPRLQPAGTLLIQHRAAANTEASSKHLKILSLKKKKIFSHLIPPVTLGAHGYFLLRSLFKIYIYVFGCARP